MKKNGHFKPSELNRKNGHSEREVALKFASEDDFDAALDIMFRVKPSCLIVDDRTIIIADSLTSLFGSLQFDRDEVLYAHELPPEEISKLRRQNLGFDDD